MYSIQFNSIQLKIHGCRWRVSLQRHTCVFNGLRTIPVPATPASPSLSLSLSLSLYLRAEGVIASEAASRRILLGLSEPADPRRRRAGLQGTGGGLRLPRPPPLHRPREPWTAPDRRPLRLFLRHHLPRRSCGCGAAVLAQRLTVRQLLVLCQPGLQRPVTLTTYLLP